MERIPRAAVVLVDGWNLLVRLAGAPESLGDPGTREEARRRLLDLLEAWADARGVRVVVAWDGRGPAAPASGERVRSVGVDPPAEADDWIAHEANRLHREGVPVRVVTRDRGLLARVPRAAASLPADGLAADLAALAGNPVRAPHLHGPPTPDGEIPAGSGPVDPARLPRRRGAPSPRPPEPAAPSAPGTAGPEPPRSPSPGGTGPGPREEARRKAERERKRARWERARRRRDALHRRKR